jgi:hypothetical protein
MALIHADVELSRRLLVIEKAMTVIFMKFALSGLPDGVPAGPRHHGELFGRAMC